MTDRGEFRVGMSGWVYPPWRGVFYPKGLTQKNELGYASSHVNSIEINGSFYSLHKPSSWQNWRDATPDDFLFSAKSPRFITHIKRLDDVHEALANFFASGILALGPKLGAILWQLPPSFEFEPHLLETFLEQLPHTTSEAVELARDRSERMTGKEWLETDADRPVRHAVEVRNRSFENEAYFDLLEKHRVASVLADTAGKWPKLDRNTTDFNYVRLHGDKKLYESGYGDDALDMWAAKVGGWLDSGRDAYVYFDNDMKVRAPVDAMGLIERLRTP